MFAKVEEPVLANFRTVDPVREEFIEDKRLPIESLPTEAAFMERIDFIMGMLWRFNLAH